MSRYGYLLAFTIPAVLIAGYYLGGWWMLLPLAYVFLIEPIFDAISGLNTLNLEDHNQQNPESESFYKLLLFLWIPVQFGILVWAVFIIGSSQLTSTWEYLSFTAGVSLVTGGIGITVAHELGHKKSKLERFLSQMLLMSVFYMHFYIEHNQGHHKNVATPEDPATARKNESFYQFWFRTVFGSYFNAWRIELRSLKKKDLQFYSYRNRMIWYLILPLLFIGGMMLLFYAVSGAIVWQIPGFLIIQSILAFTLLELVNYVEHYGILRKQKADGRFESVNPNHSWNASHKLSNYFLFQLQRHSDHHYKASRPYQLLKHHDESPQLPAGYPTMIMAALVPPLWFSVMNKRLETWENSF